jgi:transposase-like protein
MVDEPEEDPVLTRRTKVPEMDCPYCEAKPPTVETMEVPARKVVLYMCNQCGRNWSRTIR